MADENIYDEIEIEVSFSHQEKKDPPPHFHNVSLPLTNKK